MQLPDGPQRLTPALPERPSLLGTNLSCKAKIEIKCRGLFERCGVLGHLVGELEVLRRTETEREHWRESSPMGHGTGLLPLRHALPLALLATDQLRHQGPIPILATSSTPLQVVAEARGIHQILDHWKAKTCQNVLREERGKGRRD